MKSLKDKTVVVEIKSVYIQRLEEVCFSKDVKDTILEFYKLLDKLQQDYKNINEHNDYVSDEVIEDCKILHKRLFGDWEK